MNRDIIAIIREAATMGAAEVARRLRPEDDRISEREAFRIYGRGFVKANADRLTVTANGSRKAYSRSELEQVKAARSVAVLALRIEDNLTTNETRKWQTIKTKSSRASTPCNLKSAQ